LRKWIIQLVVLLLAAAAWAEPLYFVQMTDTHLSAPAEWTRARRAIISINQLPFKISCVVVTGDVFSDNYADADAVAKAKKLFKLLKVPCHLLPGNHDVPAGNSQAASIWQEAFGPLFQEAVYGGVGFTFLDSTPLAMSESALPYKPLDDLKAYLKKNPKRPTLVFTHIPSAEDFFGNTMHPGWPAKSGKAWEAVLGLGNVRAVITGHFHRDELHWIGKVPLFVCPPVAGYWGRQLKYRIYEYENGRLSYRTIYLE
jgi:3',5'-cyclic AMP phosphodiesterase CpdA